MSAELGQVIREARKQKGFLIRQLAEGLDVTPSAVSQWEGGATEPSISNLQRLAEILEIDVELLLNHHSGAAHQAPVTRRRTATQIEPEDLTSRKHYSDFLQVWSENIFGKKDVKWAPTAKSFDRLAGLTRDVPVYGIAVGGDDGEFSLNGQEVDRAMRPPGLANASGIFALYVSNDSMYPAWREGSILYINRFRKPAPGDDVVFEFYPESNGEPGKAFLKRLVSVTPTKIIVEQFNPAKTIEFDRDKIMHMFRVVPWEEALGLS